MRAGILGGTFDPPHIGHMAVAEAAFHQLSLDAVWFVPAGRPWQKIGKGVTPARRRWEMTQAAVSGIPYLDADDREISRPGPSYTIDTIEELEDHDLTLILGADAAARLPTWRRPDEVMRRVRISVAPRPGATRAAVEDVLGGDVSWLDLPPLDISATDLRRRAAAGRSLRFLVPAPVHDYIVRHGLYGYAKKR